MKRRLALLLPLAAAASARAQNLLLPRAQAMDAVHVYLVPTDDVAEQPVASLARELTRATGLWIKALPWTPSEVGAPLPGTNQYAAEDYFPLAARLRPMLQEASPRTYFIVLTSRDINSRSGNFRFQYSLHNPMASTSVLSIARLLVDREGQPAGNDVAAARVLKMLLRIVGEMRMGWRRSSDPADLMYAPLMSNDDIDRMDLAGSLQARRAGN